MLTLWAVMAAHSLLETARDSLFLAKLPATYLPWAYICIAAAAILFIQLQALLPLRGTNRQVLGMTLGLSSGVTLGLWWLSQTGQTWVLATIYVWAGVFSTLVVTRFWMVAADVFSLTQAKRVFALIGAGSVVGAIAGSGTASVLTRFFVDPRQFLVVASALMAGAAILPLLLLRLEDEGPVRSPDTPTCPNPLHWGSCTHSIRHTPYLRNLFALVLWSTVALTFVDYLFKSIVADVVPAESLPEFFATTYFCLNLASLGLQLTFVGFMLRRGGLQRSLTTMPILLGLAALWLLAMAILGPALLLLPALALKSVDGSLRHTLHRTAIETLYVPLTRELRDRVKTTLDVLGQRGGQALASLVLVPVILLPHSQWILSAAVVGLCWMWLRRARRLHSHYLDLFRTTLGEGRSHVRLDFPELDLASLETLMAHLNSENDAEVLAAMDILEEQQRIHLIPGLILYHPSSRIVVRALELFERHDQKNLGGILDRTEHHEDPEVRAAALRVRIRHAPDVSHLLHVFLDDPSPIVRMTALVGLVAAEWITGEEAEKATRSLASEAEDDEIVALLKSIRTNPAAIHTPLLLHFAEHESLDVRLEVALAMRLVHDDRHLPALLQMLAFRQIRFAARSALVSMGPAAVDYLEASLADASLPQEIRRHIPRTLARFAPETVVRILSDRLGSEGDGLVRFKILRALGHLRRVDPNLAIPTRPLDDAILETLQGCFRLLDWQLHLEKAGREDPSRLTAVHQLLHTTLLRKEHHAIERLFRLLGLRHPEEDWQQIHRGVTSSRADNRASSAELIEANLSGQLRDAVLALVDDLPVVQRLVGGRAFYRAEVRDFASLLEEFVERSSLGLRSLAYYHIAETQLGSLRPLLEARREDAPSFERDVIERALALLDDPNPQVLRYDG